MAQKILDTLEILNLVENKLYWLKVCAGAWNLTEAEKGFIASKLGLI